MGREPPVRIDVSVSTNLAFILQTVGDSNLVPDGIGACQPVCVVIRRLGPSVSGHEGDLVLGVEGAVAGAGEGVLVLAVVWKAREVGIRSAGPSPGPGAQVISWLGLCWRD